MKAFLMATAAVVTIGCVVYVMVASRSARVSSGAADLVPAAAVASAPPTATEPPPRPAVATPPSIPPAEKLAPENDRDPQTFSDRALAELESGDYATARADARRCLELDPRRSACHYALTMSFVRAGHWEEAAPLLQSCLKADPGNDACMSQLATYHVMHRQLDDAKRLVDALNSGARDTVWTHLASGEYARVTGDRDGACKHFKVACDRGQDSACTRAAETCSARQTME